jgi:hypothetical protein
MADSILNQIDLTHPIVNGARRDLCLQCAHELDDIASALPGLIPNVKGGGHTLAKALASRMLRLTSALMSALDEDRVTDNEIHQIVNFHLFDGGLG